MSDEMISAWSIEKGWYTATHPEPRVVRKRWDLVFEFGHLGYGQCLSIQSLRDGRYLAVIEHHYESGSFVEVLLPDMPSVMEFLRIYGSMFQQARLLAMLEELHELLVDDEIGLLRQYVQAKEESSRRLSDLVRNPNTPSA